MYFRMAEGHVGPLYINKFLQWPAVNALHFETSIPDGAEQTIAFFGSHDVDAVLIDARESDWWKPLIEP
jgi:hypothetical protein